MYVITTKKKKSNVGNYSVNSMDLVNITAAASASSPAEPLHMHMVVPVCRMLALALLIFKTDSVYHKYVYQFCIHILHNASY